MKTLVEIKFRKPVQKKHLESVRKAAESLTIDKSSVTITQSSTNSRLILAEFTIKKEPQSKSVDRIAGKFIDIEDSNDDCTISFPDDDPQIKSPRGRKPAIPNEIKEQVATIVENFNRKTFKNSEVFYIPRYKGKYLYLDRNEYGTVGPICRLEFLGDINDWEFAIFTYSDERYESAGFCPGMEDLDGSIVGAMKAGLEAYPVS